MSKVAPAALLLAAASLLNAQTPAPIPNQAAVNQALVKQYCTGCHNTKLKTAGVALDNLDIAKVADDAATWEKVLRKVSAHQMPPAGLPHPTRKPKRPSPPTSKPSLTAPPPPTPTPATPPFTVSTALNIQTPSATSSRSTSTPGANLPPDDSGYGFDNIGDVLSLSPVLIERYVNVGRTVARLAVGDTDVKPTIDTFTPVKEVRAASKGGPRIPRNERISDDVPFDSAGGLAIHYTFPVDAEYTFKIKMPPGPAADPNATEVPLPSVLELKIPVKAGVRQVAVTFTRSGAVPEIVPQLPGGRGGGGGGRGGAGTVPARPMTHMDVRLDGVRLKLYDLPEPANGPSFNELSIAGPYNIAGPGSSASRDKIFTCKPTSPKTEDACAAKILTDIGRHAYRRPFTALDLKPLMAFYTAGRKDGSFDHGIEMALRAILVSPDFLFRVEHDSPTAAPGSAHRVNDYELASRLSFFLWSSIPGR